MGIERRTFLQGGAAIVMGSAFTSRLARAQAEPFKLGILTIKSGPLASGGVQMEQGLTIFLNERNNTIAGRPVQVYTADTGGNPAQARSKVSELVERFGVHAIIGPVAAFELLAIDGYIRSSKTPLLTVAGAEDVTQRKPNPWLIRATGTSSQPSHALGAYAAKDMGVKRVATIADDFAFGYENVAGFQRAFEEAGGKVVQKIWTPLNSPDYGVYISQLNPNIDAIFTGHTGSNSLRFIKQLREYGIKTPLLGGFATIDEAVMPMMGKSADGTVSASWYSAELDYPSNQGLVQAFRKNYNAEPGIYGAEGYLSAQILESVLKSGVNPNDKEAFMAALRSANVNDTVRGPVKFDKFGNVVGNIFIRRVDQRDGKPVNTIIKTYPDISQFWTYPPDAFLAQPVYSADYPPAKNIEK